jgi:hypothetical protein
MRLRHAFLFFVMSFSVVLEPANLYRDKYGFPPQWKLGETWEVRSPSIVVTAPGPATRENREPREQYVQRGWILTRFTVTDVKEVEGSKIYNVDAEHLAVEGYDTPYPPGTHFVLTIDDHFILRSLVRISPTEDESRKIRNRTTIYARQLFGVGESKTVPLYKNTFLLGHEDDIGIPIVFPTIVEPGGLEEGKTSDVVVEMEAPGGTKIHEMISPIEGGKGFEMKFSLGRQGGVKNFSLTWAAGDPWWSSVEMERADGYHCVSTLQK